MAKLNRDVKRLCAGRGEFLRDSVTMFKGVRFRRDRSQFPEIRCDVSAHLCWATIQGLCHCGQCCKTASGASVRADMRSFDHRT